MPSPKDNTQHLWAAESNLPLDTAGFAVDPEAPIQADVTHPSISGELQAPGSKFGAVSTQAPTPNRPQPGYAQRPYTPSELMAMANQMEKEFSLDNNDRSTAVDAALIRPNGMTAYTPEPSAGTPDWLNDYMHNPEMTADAQNAGLDTELHGKHASERDWVRDNRNITNRNGH